jgi:hypothetical protein
VLDDQCHDLFETAHRCVEQIGFRHNERLRKIGD